MKVKSGAKTLKQLINYQEVIDASVSFFLASSAVRGLYQTRRRNLGGEHWQAVTEVDLQDTNGCGESFCAIEDSIVGRRRRLVGRFWVLK